MTTTKYKKMAAVALLSAAAALGGCGDDEPQDSAQAPSTPAATTAPSSTPAETTPKKTKPASNTPEATWANKLCNAMNGQQQQIQPPQVKGTSPESTQTSLITFFTQVVDQLGTQVETIEKVGPPPGSKAEKAWDSSVDELRTVRKEVAKLTRQVKRSDAKNPAQIQGIMEDLGKQLQGLSGYNGPVASLAKNKTLGKAIAAEPACEKYG